MGADYSFEVKNIEMRVLAFFKHNNSSVATVIGYLRGNVGHQARRASLDAAPRLLQLLLGYRHFA